MLLLLFGALNSGGRIQELGNIPYVTFFLPGILAYGIVITQFVNMAGGIAIQRDNGLLKRMRGTPLPGWAYVAGRLGSTALVSVDHDRRHARCIGRGRASTCTCAPPRCRPSSSPCCSAPPPSPRSGMAAVMHHPQRRGRARSSPTCSILPLVLHLGHLVPARPGAPEWLVDVAKFFPLERLANALHVAFDPLNHGSAWSGNDLLVLAIWLVVGTRLAMRFWQPGDGALTRAHGPEIASGCPRRASRASSRSSSRCPPIIGLLGDEPGAGPARGRRAPRSSSSCALLPRGARPDGSQAAGGRRARLRHRPGHRRAR